VLGIEFCQDIINELMKIRRNKLPFFQSSIRAMSFILSRACWISAERLHGLVM
jgi:hypothetical protein